MSIATLLNSSIHCGDAHICHFSILKCVLVSQTQSSDHAVDLNDSLIKLCILLESSSSFSNAASLAAAVDMTPIATCSADAESIDDGTCTCILVTTTSVNIETSIERHSYFIMSDFRARVRLCACKWQITMIASC